MTTLDEFVSDNLRQFRKAATAGSVLALCKAVRFCSQHNRPQPDWLTAAVITALGRNDIPKARKNDLKNQIDYMRWDAVKELRDRKNELRMTEPAQSVYKSVERLLKGTMAEAGHEMIKKSYDHVEREMQNGRGAKYVVSR